MFKDDSPEVETKCELLLMMMASFCYLYSLGIPVSFSALRDCRLAAVLARRSPGVFVSMAFASWTLIPGCPYVHSGGCSARTDGLSKLIGTASLESCSWRRLGIRRHAVPVLFRRGHLSGSSQYGCSHRECSSDSSHGGEKKFMAVFPQH